MHREWENVSDEAQDLMESWINGNRSVVVERIRNMGVFNWKDAVMVVGAIVSRLMPRAESEAFLRQVSRRLIEAKLEGEDNE
jgi:hypothetical protein